MFGGPPTPPPGVDSEDRSAIGGYDLVHNLAAIGERLFATPNEIVQLDIRCPATGDLLLGRANKYTRSFTIYCPTCTFTINR